MKRRSLSDNVFNFFNIAIMTIITIITFYIFWYCVVGAFSNGSDFMNGENLIWPKNATFDNFKSVLSDVEIYYAFLISVLRTVIGTTISVFFTVMVAYGMTRKDLKFRNFYSIFMLITMFFGGGLIPTFILYDKLGLMDTFLVYIIPGIFSVYNMIIVRNSISSLPQSVFEAARVDGCGEYRTLFQIVMPMSKGVIMTIVLYNAVAHWNAYYDTLMYTSDPMLQTAQYYLYNMITKAENVNEMLNQGVLANPDLVINVTSQTVRMAATVVISLPILLFYPFIQKHFVKGVLIGSIKE